MKTITITQKGIIIGGNAMLELWGGETGMATMDDITLLNKHITPKNILRAVNDGGFGCVSILSANIDISILYNNNMVEFDRTIEVEEKDAIHTKYFNNLDPQLQ